MLWKRIRSDETGQNLILTTLGMMAMLTMSALVIDVGFTLVYRREVQNAADAASLAAMRAYALDETTASIDTAVGTYAPLNGADAVSWAFTGEPSNRCGGSADACLQVVASRTFATFFAGLLGRDEFTVSARSTALRSGVSQMDHLWPMAFRWEDYELGRTEFWEAPVRHFDVDSFGDEKHNGDFKKMYHKHEFDHQYGNAIEIMTFADFKWSNAMQYVSNVSIRFKNTCNAAGSYRIKRTGADPYEGAWPGAVGELQWIVTNLPISQLEYIHLFPSNLNRLRGTEPKVVQNDPYDRGHAYTLQVYNSDTGLLAFEFSIYEHVSSDEVRDRCAGYGGIPMDVPNWSWVDFNGAPSSEDELAEALCHPEESPMLSVDDTVAEIAGVQNASTIEDCLNQWIGQMVYVPIYDSLEGIGPDAELHIAGFAAFVLESFNLSNDSGHIVGHFVQDVVVTTGGGPNHGLQSIWLAR